MLGVQVSATTQRRLTYAAGSAAVAVEEAEVTQIERDLPPVLAQSERMQLSIDATKVPLVGGAWTDAKLAVIADLVPAVDADGHPTVEAVNLSYVARWEPAEVFARTLTGEAHRRGVEAARDLASPNDGAEWIQGVLDHSAPTAVRILDEPHAAEHLGTISALIHGEHTAAATAWTPATAWTQRQRTRLKREEPDGVLGELTRVLTQGPHPRAAPGPDGLTPAAHLAREVTYFHTRAAQIRYAAVRHALYPIGSGIVESGHKVVISPRFKRAGQHWAPQHLTPLLVLRTTLCNDRWAERWPLLWTQQQQTLTAARQATQQQRQATQQQRQAARQQRQAARQQRQAARQQRQAARQQRQAARQAATVAAPATDAPTADCPATDAPTADCPATDASAPQPSHPTMASCLARPLGAAPRRGPSARPLGAAPRRGPSARPLGAAPRRPSADHPWRRPFRSPPHQRAC